MNKSLINAWKSTSKTNAPVSKPVFNPIYLLTTTIAGLYYTNDAEDLIDDLYIGNMLLLDREPDNKHDKYAIIVRNNKCEKLGYIPRETNKIIARLMDGAKYIYGMVKTINDEDEYNRVVFDVFFGD